MGLARTRVYVEIEGDSALHEVCLLPYIGELRIQLNVKICENISTAFHIFILSRENVLYLKYCVQSLLNYFGEWLEEEGVARAESERFN